MTPGETPPPAETPPDWTTVRDLATAHETFRAWMFGRALPFWAGIGHDAAVGGAREHLRLEGVPADPPFTRMRVQARQIYCFSHAALLGWPDGERLARAGYRFITRVGERTDGGWVRRLTPDGRTVLDAAVDLYDQAFVLLALAFFARLTGEAEPLDRARRTLDWISAHMTAPGRGFDNVRPVEPGPRLQNPHMHLLEAALALLETSGDRAWQTLACSLLDLFHDHLFDHETGTLGEFFAADWTPARGAAGTHREPGHHFEWVWLLDEAERRTGRAVTGAIERLYAFAVRHGTDRETGLAFDVVDRDGSAQARSVRLWPQMEAIRAHATMARRGHGTAGSIPGLVRIVGRTFLANCPEGAWIDHFDANGTPIADRIPTSSLYHLFTCYDALRLAARR